MLIDAVQKHFTIKERERQLREQQTELEQKQKKEKEAIEAEKKQLREQKTLLEDKRKFPKYQEGSYKNSIVSFGKNWFGSLGSRLGIATDFNDYKNEGLDIANLKKKSDEYYYVKLLSDNKYMDKIHFNVNKDPNDLDTNDIREIIDLYYLFEGDIPSVSYTEDFIDEIGQVQNENRGTENQTYKIYDFNEKLNSPMLDGSGNKKYQKFIWLLRSVDESKKKGTGGSKSIKRRKTMRRKQHGKIRHNGSIYQ